MDFYGGRFYGIYSSYGEVYGAYIYIHACDAYSDISNTGNSIQDSRSKPVNIDSTNLQLLYTHQDMVRSTRLFRTRPA